MSSDAIERQIAEYEARWADVPRVAGQVIPTPEGHPDVLDSDERRVEEGVRAGGFVHAGSPVLFGIDVCVSPWPVFPTFAEMWRAA